MPSRILSQNINVSNSISKLTPLEEVVFLHLLVTCDDYGRFHGDPDIVKGNLFPKRKAITSEQIEKALQKLEAEEMIRRYESGGMTYLELTSWLKFQTPRAKSSKYPGPNDADSQMIMPEVAGTCERAQTTPSKPKQNPVDAEKFEKFWAAYPNRKDKKKAFELWKKINPDDELFEKIMLAVDYQSKSYDWQKEDGRYVPMPTTWLRNERWNDQVRSGGTSKSFVPNHSITDGGSGNPFRQEG